MDLDPSRTAFLFPGQGSQQIGMGWHLAQEFPAAQEVFDQTDELLGHGLSRILWEGPREALDDTANTQPGLLAHSIAALRVWQKANPDFQPSYVAGHSMGEFSALVAAGALSFPEALGLVRKRGELMKATGERSPGGMAAIIGLDISMIENICLKASEGDGFAQVANDNCPGQVVISGTAEALERAMALAWEADPINVVRLDVRLAGHSPLMRSVADEFSIFIHEAGLSDARLPLVGNVNAEPLASADSIRDELKEQLTSPVRWADSMRFMIARDIDTFIEFGSGDALRGMLRRFDPGLVGIGLSTARDFERLGVLI